MSSIWHSGCLAFDRGLALKDRFVGTDVAVCTISCKKKIFEKQHNYACTLTAISDVDQIHPPTSSAACSET